jgi:hypothetical protein
MIEQLRKRELLMSIILIILVAAITFLPLVSQLGYYHDDWHIIVGEVSGTSLIRMYTIDRPGLGVVYTITHALLGDNQLNWNLFTFAIKITGAVLLLVLLRLLWPQKKLETFLVVLIFVIYPGFLQEPSANTFSNQFIAYTAAIFSILASIVVLKNHSKLIRLTCLVLGVLSGMFYLFIYEYMIGLEAVRVLLMGYILFQPPVIDKKRQLRSLFLNWLPYFFGTLAFLIWRIFIFQGSRQTTNVAALFQSYESQPVNGFLTFLFEIIKSFVNSVIVAWGLPFYTVTISAELRDLMISIILGLVGVGLFLGYTFWLEHSDNAKSTVLNPKTDHWARDSILLGIVIIFVTLVPVIFSKRAVIFNSGFDRYTLQSTIGIGLLVIGVIFYVPSTIWQKTAIAILVALSIVTQYNNAAYHRNFWAIQKNLWWQTTWRVPDLKDGTVLMPLLPPTYRLGEDFEIWAPWNLIYHPQPGSIKVVSEVLNYDTAQEIINGVSSEREFRTISLNRQFTKALVASMPTMNSCVHYIDGNKPQYSGSEDPLILVVGQYSHIDQINLNGSAAHPPVNIFSTEPDHNWCYYYEKADLARQAQDWRQVVKLGDEAIRLGFSPKDTSEWLPFIEGYFTVGDDDRAAQLAQDLAKDVSASNWICMPITNGKTSYTTEFISFMSNNVCR